MSTKAKQPREHPVPCQGCGYRIKDGKPVVVVKTMNVSGFCDECERRGWDPNPAAIVASLERLQQDIERRGGQRRARPYIQSQLRRLRNRTW